VNGTTDFDVNGLAKRIPQVDEVGDNDTLCVLRRDFSHQQGRADTALDPRDLRLDTRAQAVTIFLVERINAFFPRGSKPRHFER
jgi:hypothetical protein